MSIPVVKPLIRRKDMDAVLTCLVEDHLSPGNETSSFVQEVLDLCGCDSGIALRDSVTGWRTVFKALAAQGVSTAAVSVLAPMEISMAAEGSGVQLVLLDTHADNPLPDLAGLSGVEVQALVLNYTCGFIPDMAGLAAVCREKNLILVEDLSHCFCHRLLAEGLSLSTPESKEDGLGLESAEGEVTMSQASQGGPEPGSLGKWLVIQTEFDSLLTTGGGCLVLARDHGGSILLGQFEEDLSPTVLMSDMNAALGRSQIKALPEMLKRRHELASSFRSSLKRGRHRTFSLPFGQYPHSFPVLVQTSVADVQALARKKGVETAFAFNTCLLRKTMGESAESARAFPKGFGMMLRTLLFPLHCGLHHKDVELIQKLLPSLP